MRNASWYTAGSPAGCALNVRSFKEYRAKLAGDSDELVQFCNAITTNLTAFFREPHHFDHLKTEILQPLVANPPAQRRLRIWSAACSTGEEPYTLAMTVLEAIPELSRWDIKILATDLDSDVLGKASRGHYHEDRIRGLSAERRKRFFKPVAGAREPTFAVSPELQRLITFKQLNLMHPFPMKGPIERHRLPQRAHLFRQGHAGRPGGPHVPTATTGRSAVPRPLGIAVQGFHRLHADRPHRSIAGVDASNG